MLLLCFALSHFHVHVFTHPHVHTCTFMPTCIHIRSISSPHPFEGSESNLQRMFSKASEKLEVLIGSKERATESEVR